VVRTILMTDPGEADASGALHAGVVRRSIRPSIGHEKAGLGFFRGSDPGDRKRLTVTVPALSDGIARVAILG